MNICPCCKRRIPQSKSAVSTKADRKLKQDIERADFAIGVLIRAQSNPLYPYTLQQACVDEQLRMERAKTDRKLLWSIYRRRDKGESYVKEDN